MSGMNIGQEIVILRAEKGWTQQQFAEKLKTSQRTVAAWEAGDSVPRKTMKVKIAQAFGLPVNHFLNAGESDVNVPNFEHEDDGERDIKTKKLLEHIEDFISNSGQGIDEEKKKMFLESIQGILDMTERKK